MKYSKKYPKIYNKKSSLGGFNSPVLMPSNSITYYYFDQSDTNNATLEQVNLGASVTLGGAEIIGGGLNIVVADSVSLSTYLDGVSGDQWPVNNFTIRYRFEYLGDDAAAFPNVFRMFSDSNNSFFLTTVQANAKQLSLGHKVAGTQKTVTVTLTSDVSVNDILCCDMSLDSSNGLNLTVINETKTEQDSASDATAVADIVVPASVDISDGLDSLSKEFLVY